MKGGNPMTITDIWKDKDGEDFDENETTDLPLHVRQCIRRDRRTARMLRLVLGMVALELLIHFAGNVPGIWSLIAKLAWPS